MARFFKAVEVKVGSLYPVQAQAFFKQEANRFTAYITYTNTQGVGRKVVFNSDAMELVPDEDLVVYQSDLYSFMQSDSLKIFNFAIYQEEKNGVREFTSFDCEEVGESEFTIFTKWVK
ncbi:TPA: hypothetical protein M2Q89_000682 [Escherichia coli]|nr:hypothetical protein [Escherichia coli]